MSVDLRTDLVAVSYARADAVGHVGAVDDDETGVTLIEDLAERLEVVAAHAARDVPRVRAERRPGAAADRERGDDADAREQRRHGAGGEAPAEPHLRVVMFPLVVPAHDLDVAGLVLGDHRGIEVQ